MSRARAALPAAACVLLGACHLLLPFSSREGAAGDQRALEKVLVEAGGDRTAGGGDIAAKPDRIARDLTATDRPAERPAVKKDGPIAKVDLSVKKDVEVAVDLSVKKDAPVALADFSAGTWVVDKTNVTDLVDVSGSSASDVFVVGPSSTVLHRNSVGWTAVTGRAATLGDLTSVTSSGTGQALATSAAGLVYSCTPTSCTNHCTLNPPGTPTAIAMGSAIVVVGQVGGSSPAIWTGCLGPGNLPAIGVPQGVGQTGSAIHVAGTAGVAWSGPGGTWSTARPGNGTFHDVCGSPPLVVGDGGAIYRWAGQWNPEAAPIPVDLKGCWTDGTASLAVGAHTSGGVTSGVVLRKVGNGGWATVHQWPGMWFRAVWAVKSGAGYEAFVVGSYSVAASSLVIRGKW